jgi:hypothetical protein
MCRLVAFVRWGNRWGIRLVAIQASVHAGYCGLRLRHSRHQAAFFWPVSTAAEPLAVLAIVAKLREADEMEARIAALEEHQRAKEHS